MSKSRAGRKTGVKHLDGDDLQSLANAAGEPVIDTAGVARLLGIEGRSAARLARRGVLRAFPITPTTRGTKVWVVAVASVTAYKTSRIPQSSSPGGAS
jgi:hypothetical protein